MAGDPMWIEHAHLKKGAFTKKADAAGKSVGAFAEQKESAPGTLGKQARAAQALRGLHHLVGKGQ